MDTLTLAATAIWLGQKTQAKRFEEAVERVVQALPVTTAPEPSEPNGFTLVNQVAAEEVLKDCGHSNCTDFGSSDILYG